MNIKYILHPVHISLTLPKWHTCTCTYIHTHKLTHHHPSITLMLPLPFLFSMLSLSLVKLLTCGVIRSYNCLRYFPPGPGFTVNVLKYFKAGGLGVVTSWFECQNLATTCYYMVVLHWSTDSELCAPQDFAKPFWLPKLRPSPTHPQAARTCLSVTGGETRDDSNTRPPGNSEFVHWLIDFMYFDVSF